jgi:hypothetical protein
MAETELGLDEPIGVKGLPIDSLGNERAAEEITPVPAAD